VAAPTIILALKLAGLREQHPNGSGDFIDFAPLLRMARALGAFIDFTELRELTKESPYAKAFMELMGALEEGWGSELPEHYVDDQRARIANVRELVDSLRRRYPTLSNYEALGGEYYDARRHPACAEFRLASKALIDELLPASLEGALLETGAGDSLFAELLHERGHTLEQLIISDAYPAMLTHSQRWCDLGAMTLLAPADALPLADASIEFVVAALADPYNHPSFWREAARVLELGGQMLFTTPTYDWTMAFRAGEHAATLALGDDLHVVVPSVVLPEAEQRQMIEGVGLTVLAVTHFLRWQFRPAVASDALLGLAEDDAVISCFHCCR
jgi:SAM-dependent methyltransferase